ncbi:hypothetical protein PLICRDRAFT_103090 [Plicaturopsis crispa FD-325 SS-3]|nr:hypothetical protein PLICRDRAFT_103090 [Plicaturopsis crispa FD-325 SS-3]
MSPLSLVFLFLVLHTALVSAQDDASFDCHLTIDSYKYDLTQLAGEHTVSRTRDTPPSSMVDTLRFDLCAELKPQDGIAESDQCPSGTRACLTKTNKKTNQADRIVAVVPIAQTSSLNAQSSAQSSPKGVLLTLHGASYPSPLNPQADPIEQSLQVNLTCATEASDPTFSTYDGAQLKLDWLSPAGCGFKGDGESPSDDEGGKGEDKQENVGSGIGWFFLVLLLAFVAYFGLGAYYNYSTYGASGADLIPHRDFWKEVPYMLSDVVSHLCSTVRPRRTSNRGYISV